MPETPGFNRNHSAVRYALIGTCLGLFAPVGWLGVRYLLFAGPDAGLWAGTVGHAFGDAENLALLLYMGIGTASVFGAFGFRIGGSSQDLRNRAHDLDVLNRTIVEQKELFETRFCTLDDNLKKFHASNARIQRSVDRTEVLRLAAESLHLILGYDRVNLLHLDSDGTVLRFVASCAGGRCLPIGSGFPFDRRAGILYRSITENRLFLVEDIRQMPPDHRLSSPWSDVEQLRSRSFVICPVVVHGRPVGLLAVDNKVRQRVLTETDVDTVRLFASQVSAALGKIQLLEAVESLIGELQLTFAEMAKYRQQYEQLVTSLRHGATATTTAIGEIASSAEVVRTVVDDTSSASSEISMAIEEVSGSLERLQQFLEVAVSGMTEITSTAREIESSAGRSHVTSEQVLSHAAAGVQTVDDAFRGLQAIAGAVEQTGGVIDALANKSEEIDRIIAVIHEINQKTNLLSLNAAIIAAQAGEHGRSFAVVADQIRGLSQETMQSATGIESLVQEIRHLTMQAVQHIGATRQMVERDVRLGQETNHALSRIHDSSETAIDMTRDIRKATAEQVRSSQSISRSIEELGDMSTQLSHAAREQTQGIRRIVQSIEEIKTMAEEMARATARQSDATRGVDSAVDQVGMMGGRIFAAMAEREMQSYRVIEQLEALKQPVAGESA